MLSFILLVCLSSPVCPPQVTPAQASRARAVERSEFTGVYRIDIPASDKLYSVVAGASSSVPFSDQQRFFIDLAVRLTPPDLLAIEQRGRNVSLGSSRAPRMDFVADGVIHKARAQDGDLVSARLFIENTAGNPRLVFSSSGKAEDNFSVVFEALDKGKRLRVTRRITAAALDQPLVIRTFYNKISDVARWELYGEEQVASSGANTSGSPSSPSSERTSAATTARAQDSREAHRPLRSGSSASEFEPSVEMLRAALNEWLKATNDRDIERQMSFYVPRLKAYYLSRNTPLSFVRDDKSRVFARASLIDIRAEEPEIIFQDGGRTAIMRYRKKYRVENGRQSRRGEVIQELRWQRVDGDRSRQSWRIFSERDISVL